MKKHEIIKDDYFGTIVEEPYRWLEDDNAEEVKEWVQEENKKTENFLSQIPFRGKIKNRLEEIWDYEKRSGLFKAGDYYYFFRTEGLKNQSVLYRQKDCEKAEENPELFFDPNKLSDDGTIALKNVEFSKDGKKMLYSVSGSGSDWEEIFVFDTEKKENTGDHLKWVKFSNLAWYKDGFFYSAYDAIDEENLMTSKNEYQKIKYHKLGTDQKEDIVVFKDDTNPLRYFGASTSSDERLIFIFASEGASEANVLYIANLTDGLPKNENDFIQFNKDPKDGVRPVELVGDYLYLLTNKDAPFYKLIRTPIEKMTEDYAEVVIPEENCLLSNAVICGETENAPAKIIAVYLKDVQNEVYSFDLDGKNKNKIDLEQNGSIGISGARKKEKELFFTFTSYTTPNKIIKYDIQKNELKDFFIPKVKMNIDDFKCEQVFFESKDGTKVPMHIVSKKDVKLDGSNPTILYGYGGFSISLLPYFSAARMAFIEAGGIFVCANLRGGLDLMILFQQQNT